MEQIKIEEMRDKRIKAEKIHYGQREVRRKIKAAKEVERVFDKKTKRWVFPSPLELLDL